MEVLLAHGGSPNAVERGQQEIPAVVLASALGNLSCLRALLSTAVPVDLEVECFGLTPLMHAAKDGHAECCQYLLERGAKIDAVRGATGWTPLFFACNQGKQNTVRLLLERGANPRLADTSGQTALHVSTSPRIVETLLRYGADPNAMDNELRTCLFRPSLVADYMAIMHLVRFGAEPLLAHAAHVQRISNIKVTESVER
jgi:ankyrin repeat protein